MATRPSSRAATAARSAILGALVDDHKRVKKAFRDFKKLDTESDTEAAEALVQQVLMELQIHAALEEELLYPAAREALKDTDMLDEAEVEHESAHTLINQLSAMSPGDDKYFARFTVLCEYVLHHVKEEEGEMFPALETAKLDWEALA
ncbi:MAG: hemerythrin domain-containing protein, partial [Hydrogenophaga sp.]|nr:hemerythrin domain-containing protein [Hydrogenophaga sp.]